MFQKLRRDDRKMDKVETIKLLKNENYGILSTINNDGYPYGVPLSFVYINNNIYFHSALDGNKIINITGNNKASFCIVGETNLVPEEFTVTYKSVIVFGKAVEVNDEEKEKALFEIIKKYSGQFIEKGKKYIEKDQDKTRVFKLEIEHISGKSRD